MSKIEWTGKTWNPIVGCAVVSPGCTNCYAMRMAARLGRMGQDRYAGLTKPSKAGPVWTGETRLVESALTLPLRTRKPTTWFVNSMSDLFAESVPEEWIARVFNVMADAPHHTFQVLTKRSARMRQIMAGPKDHALWSPKLWHRSVLPNVWLGVSAEDQRRADERVPDLLATPAAVRFVSAEPLLGPIEFSVFPRAATAIDRARPGFDRVEHLWFNALTGEDGVVMRDGTVRTTDPGEVARLDWIIVGSESGPRARPCDLAWVRSIRDQCESAGVAMFWKQHVEAGRKVSTPELDGRRWVELPR